MPKYEHQMLTRSEIYNQDDELVTLHLEVILYHQEMLVLRYFLSAGLSLILVWLLVLVGQKFIESSIIGMI